MRTNPLTLMKPTFSASPRWAVPFLPVAHPDTFNLVKEAALKAGSPVVMNVHYDSLTFPREGRPANFKYGEWLAVQAAELPESMALNLQLDDNEPLPELLTGNSGVFSAVTLRPENYCAGTTLAAGLEKLSQILMRKRQEGVATIAGITQQSLHLFGSYPMRGRESLAAEKFSQLVAAGFSAINIDYFAFGTGGYGNEAVWFDETPALLEAVRARTELNGVPVILGVANWFQTKMDQFSSKPALWPTKELQLMLKRTPANAFDIDFSTDRKMQGTYSDIFLAIGSAGKAEK